MSASPTGASARAVFKSPLERLPQTRKQPHDTSAGCRVRAAEDLVRAEGAGTPSARAKMEHSSATWTARADILHRLETSFEARRTGAPKS